MKVAYIDDDPEDQLYFKHILNKLQFSRFELNQFTDGHLAIEAILHDQPDLIFLDYQLGTLTAEDVLTQLKIKGVDIPVIILTGHGSEQLVIKLVKLGATDYLVKSDFNENSLSNAIMNVMVIKDAKMHEQLLPIRKLSFFHIDGRLMCTYVPADDCLELDRANRASDVMFVSSLVVINNFIQEAAKVESIFHEMRSEGLVIVTEKGKWIYGVIITEETNMKLRFKLKQVITKIESDYGETLERWNGKVNDLKFDHQVKTLCDPL